MARAARGRLVRQRERPIHMARLIGELNRAMPDDGILVADGGFASHWARAPLRHQAERAAASSPTAASPRSATGCRAASAPSSASPGATRRRPHRRRRPQHDDRRAGDGAPDRRRLHPGASSTTPPPATSRRCSTPCTAPAPTSRATWWRWTTPPSPAPIGCAGIRVERPEDLAPAFARGAWATRGTPTVVDVVVTRDPAKMLPAVDNRTLTVEKGDRPVRGGVRPLPREKGDRRGNAFVNGRASRARPVDRILAPAASRFRRAK